MELKSERPSRRSMQKKAGIMELTIYDSPSKI
jgi:hypothetical protein